MTEPSALEGFCMSFLVNTQYAFWSLLCIYCDPSSQHRARLEEAFSKVGKREREKKGRKKEK